MGVFAHRRPENLRLALDSIERSSGFRGRNVHIFCDAARSDAEAGPVVRTREVAARFAARTGARVVPRQQNQGFRNITDGITELCAEHGRVVVVEDDLVLAPDTLEYFERALDHYADQGRVWMVSASNYPDAFPPRPEFLFLPVALIWGWATWSRAWARYDPAATGHEGVLAHAPTRDRFDVGQRGYFSKILRHLVEGRLRTWDIQWYLAMFLADGLALHPHHALTWNTGTGAGEHYGAGPDEPSAAPLMPLAHSGVSRFAFHRPRLSGTWEFPPVQVDPRSIARLERAVRRNRMGEATMKVRQRLWSLVRGSPGGRAPRKVQVDGTTSSR